MKKVVGLLFVISVILAINLISTASALEIQLLKSSYYPGETLQAEIPDAFIGNLQLDNIGIYKENQVHKASVVSGILKSENEYLFYAVLPETAGNYTLKIENIGYYENNVQTQGTIAKTFLIIPTNSSYLSFNPGQIYATNDFSIKIKAYNAAQQVNVEFPSTGFKQTFNLGYGAEKTVYFSISGITGFTKSSIKINNYNIQVIISPKAMSENQTNQTTNLFEPTSPLEKLIEISPSKINAAILPKLGYSFNIYIINKANQSLKNISLSSSNKEIQVQPSVIETLENERIINITISSEKEFAGFINFTYKNSSILIPVNILIAENKSAITSNILPVNLQSTCTGIGGIICDTSKSEECTGLEKDSRDGACCMAECQAKMVSKAWIWGIVIIVILAIGGWLLYKKSNKGLGAEKLKGLFKKETEDYEKRMKPEQKPVEVTKSLFKK